MSANQWPTESDCIQFYGDPRGLKNPAVVNPMWVVDNLVWVNLPFKMYYLGRPLTRFQAHRKVQTSLEQILSDLWTKSGQSQQTLDQWGASQFGGCFNYRLKRSVSELSVHSFGAAVDLDPANNVFHSESFKFTPDSPVVQSFEAAGWEWGGSWKKPDAMHFQAARS